jgi:hypothetical protein
MRRIGAYIYIPNLHFFTSLIVRLVSPQIDRRPIPSMPGLSESRGAFLRPFRPTYLVDTAFLGPQIYPFW